MAWQKIVPYMAAGTKDIEDVYETKIMYGNDFSNRCKIRKSKRKYEK